MTLGHDFKAFFEALWGYAPFAWQARLAEEVQAEGWPDAIDVPTGCGKTSVLDVGVFELARQLAEEGIRTAPLRLALVIDRRVVVDQAYIRAQRLAEKIARADEGPLAAVGCALGLAAGKDAEPLVAAALRGGAPLQRDWARTPCQPLIVSSTVDQLGSRLLFRGYGVSERMAPIHAGLLGTDCRVFLDEAHLAEPFRQTLEGLQICDGLLAPKSENAGRSPTLTVLSATLGEKGGEERRLFSLNPVERKNELIAKRTGRLKRATLIETKKAQDTEDFATALADEARRLGGQMGDKTTVGVIVNRVATARQVHAMLGADAVLVTGRSRPLDREDIARRLASIETGKDRAEAPAFVVATQTLEAGADLDLDALVTQAAPLDALRQRFGRLNRAGRREEASAVILAAKDDLSKKGEPVYGTKTGACWNLLKQIAEEETGKAPRVVDMATVPLDEKIDGRDITGAVSGRPDAPVLMPAYLDLWSRTSPCPLADPEPALFLHGMEAPRPEVSLMWRAGLSVAKGDEDGRAFLSFLRPRTGEMLPLPFGFALAWLERRATGPLADIDSHDSASGDSAGEPRRAFRWRGPNDAASRWITPNDLRPGDVIVLDAVEGGCDQYGWIPEYEGPVRDLCLEAALTYKPSTLHIPLTEAFLAQSLSGEPGDRQKAAALMRLVDNATNETGDEMSAQSFLAAFVNAAADRDMEDVFAELVDGNAQLRRDDPFIILKVSVPKCLRGGTDAPPATEDERSGSLIGRQSLREHARAVEAKAKAFADCAGLPDKIAKDIATAAWLHDHGKADLRFQAFLRGGDPMQAVAALEGDEAVLAKGEAGSPRGAWARANLPEGFRHEALSVRIALEHERLAKANDPALVAWLIGTHHGHGRPFFPGDDPADDGVRRLPEVEDEVPGTLGDGDGPQRLGFTFPALGRNDDALHEGLDWPQLFVLLQRRYGVYGLARLEAVLRLADHRASEEAETTR